MSDRRGVVYVETLVAFLPVLALFLGTLQVVDFGVAHLIVQHASTTAARAAAVVLPDDGAYYEDRDNAHLNQFTGLRRVDVERAADLILRANPRLQLNGPNVSLDKNSYAARDDLIATVRARYHCLIAAFCGSGLDLAAESKLVYQGAKFTYEPMTLGDIPLDRGRHDTQRSLGDDGDPRRGEREGEPLFSDNGKGPKQDERDPRKPGALADSEPTRRPPKVDVAKPGEQEPPSGKAPVDLTKPTDRKPPVDLTKPSDREPPLVAVAPTPARPTCTGPFCGIPGGQCFAAGTLVYTADGDRPIESLRVGDRVWSRDENTGELALKRVTALLITDDKPVLELGIERHQSSERLTVTPGHPFWVERRGWVDSDELAEGALLWSPEGSLTAHAGAAWGARAKVYNLTVEDFHTYFVGGLHAWVHNNPRCPDAAAPPPELFSPGSGPLALPPSPTTRDLRGVRRLTGEARWQAGEQWAQEIYGSPGQEYFPVPADPAVTAPGGRHVDAPARTPQGGTLAVEVKTYKEWRTVDGVPQQNSVPLSPTIREQILKDVAIRRNDPSYDPRWAFLDAPPSKELADFLIENKIIFLVYD